MKENDRRNYKAKKNLYWIRLLKVETKDNWIEKMKWNEIEFKEKYRGRRRWKEAQQIIVKTINIYINPF